MLKYNPNDRISASQALEHSWFKMKIKSRQIDDEIERHAIKNLNSFHASSKL